MPVSRMPPDWRRGRSVVSALHAHLVFVPKYRQPVFDDELLDTCETSMSKVCDDFSAELVEFNGEANHVHLLVEYPPTVQLSRLVNSLKGVSARTLRRDHGPKIRQFLWGKSFWSPSYFAGSVGGAPISVLRTYIENQHRPGTPQRRGSSRP